MKKIAYLLVMVAIISSCTGSSETEVPTPQLPDPMIEVENNENETDGEMPEDDLEGVESEESESSETQTGSEMTEENTNKETSSGTSVSTDIRAELENGTENEQAVLEILNEIEEVFELAEQNGEQ